MSSGRLISGKIKNIKITLRYIILNDPTYPSLLFYTLVPGVFAFPFPCLFTDRKPLGRKVVSHR